MAVAPLQASSSCCGWKAEQTAAPSASVVETTTVAAIELDQPVVLQGTVASIEEGSFVLTDATGSISVTLNGWEQDVPVTAGEIVTVHGSMGPTAAEGETAAVEATRLVLADGSVIEVPVRVKS